MCYIIRDILSNTISDKIEISLNLIYPDLIKNVFNHKIKYTTEKLSFWGHQKTAVTTAIKTMARCGHLSQSFLLNL